MTRREYQAFVHLRLKLAALQDDVKEARSKLRRLVKKCDHTLPDGNTAWQRNGKHIAFNRQYECCICRTTEVS